MPTTTMLADTPRYVLKDGFRPIGPRVAKEADCSPIYGFTDKAPYDRFCMNSELALTPYPLVKVYLRLEANTTVDGLKLVVIDATGPRDPCLQAATIQAVLEAQEGQMAQVNIAYRLVFDQESESYLVEAI